MRMKLLAAALGSVAIFILISGCTSRPVVAGPPNVQAVMDAQHTAKSETKPMDGDEADVIYKNYVANIGKPVKPTSGLENDNTR